MPALPMEPNFDKEEIRAAERHLVTLLEDPDVSKRVAAYTDDAIFAMSGAPAVHGRDEMMRRPKRRLFSVSLSPMETEGHGRLACVYGRFAAVVDRTDSSDGRPIAMRFLIVWRKEADGVWRIAKEFLNTEETP
jgi:ketosteroid isomerase-like protein